MLPGAGMEQPPCPGHTGGTCVLPPAQSSPGLQGFQHGTTLRGAVPNPQSDSCPWQRRKLPSGPGAGRGREIPPIQPSDPGAKGRSGGCCRVKHLWQQGCLCPSHPQGWGCAKGCQSRGCWRHRTPTPPREAAQTPGASPRGPAIDQEMLEKHGWMKHRQPSFHVETKNVP